MQKWEYCIITGVKINSTGRFDGKSPRLYFFALNGVPVETERPKELEKVGDNRYIANTIAKLGFDGWEMVSTGRAEDPMLHYIYFRQPIE